MRRITFVGLVLVAVFATAASSASARPKLLYVTGPGATVIVEPYDDFAVELATEGGTVTCQLAGDGVMVTNHAATDEFKEITTPETRNYYCEGPLGYQGEGSEANVVTFSTKGKATIDHLTFSVAWAPPYENCVYSATNLKGSNTVSGLLSFDFSGKLRGTGCPEKKITYKTAEPLYLPASGLGQGVSPAGPLEAYLVAS